MSIMHYDLTAFSKNGKPTMELKKTEQASRLTEQQLETLGNVPDLSAKDIKELRMYFKCDGLQTTDGNSSDYFLIQLKQHALSIF